MLPYSKVNLGFKVAQVQVYLDNTLASTSLTAASSFTWNTTQSSNGTHTLQATACDAASNCASVTSTVTVDNSLPTVTITSAVVTKNNKVNVSVTATDNVGVVKVELYLDGKLNQTDTTAPYTFSVNTAPLPSGSHTLQAKAYDAAGNVGLSNTVAFTK